MAAFDVLLLVATLLCGLVAGLLLAFAVVVMPGIAALDDRGFLRAFRAIDGVIRGNQPVFVLVWLGSVVALLATAGVGLAAAEGADRVLVLGAAVLYLMGVQLPTLAVNVPLNNRLQALELGALSAGDLAAERARFEPRWNTSNRVRTVLSCVVVLLLLVVAA